ncbi:Molybdopterin-guanine dinucleotide biosynthesis protein MobA [Hyphomicrobium sulfonivorans]|uniref:Molybdenum cofactor guanylyltransferase n=1 Tax=Hyphomicrobium sulfonivorans TaxID=121290 RepID=A0A109B8X2_HYPSL|nr:molybdenum cofactor guanylyltransferase MobA [Hyphomicrobium sulfonivorans]KWT64328.1 Molybdopterin-guanine dinucleotide biosynthesis protein MobA [Hyphomicrobium sulfonivorans]
MQSETGTADIPDRRASVVGILLAGGLSSRMGGPEKSLLDLGGRPMLWSVLDRMAPQVGQIAINANGDPARFAAFPHPIVADAIPGHAGPLAGLHAGLLWTRREAPAARYVATASADSPFLPLDLVQRLAGAIRSSGKPCAIAAYAGEKYPVAGLWSIDLAEAATEALARNMRALHRFAEANDCATVEFPSLSFGDISVDPFFNVNTPEEYEQARAIHAAATNLGAL